jgi:hypothetical protein
MGLGGFSEAAKAVSHPTLLFQTPLHAPTGSVRQVSRFFVEQKTTQAHDADTDDERLVRYSSTSFS